MGNLFKKNVSSNNSLLSISNYTLHIRAKEYDKSEKWTTTGKKKAVEKNIIL